MSNETKIASRINSKDPNKLLEDAAPYLAAAPTFNAMQNAVDDYKKAEEDLAAFKATNAAILKLQEDIYERRRKAEASVYGLLVHAMQSNEVLISIDESEESAKLSHDGNLMPTGLGYQVKYEVIGDEAEIYAWAVAYNPALLRVDMVAIEDYIKYLSRLGKGVRNKKKLPTIMPPAAVEVRVLPTFSLPVAVETVIDTTQPQSIIPKVAIPKKAKPSKSDEALPKIPDNLDDMDF